MFTHRYVTLETDRRLTLHVAEAGPEDGPLVVLLHGFPDCWMSFARQAPALVDRYRIVMPDQRGYNTSDKPRGVSAYSLDTLAADIVALIRSYGRERAHAVVGHDWGAAVAWQLAILRPEMVAKVGVVNVPHPATFRDFLLHDSDQRRRSSYMLFFQTPRLPEWALSRHDFALLRKILRAAGGAGAFSQEELELYKKTWDHPGVLTSMLNWYRAAGRSLAKTIPKTPVAPPVQIIWGCDDPALKPEMGRKSLELCADGRLHEIAGAKHWVQRERPDEVNAVLRRFLDE